jgi:hypothetical protein
MIPVLYADTARRNFQVKGFAGLSGETEPRLQPYLVTRRNGRILRNGKQRTEFDAAWQRLSRSIKAAKGKQQV